MELVQVNLEIIRPSCSELITKWKFACEANSKGHLTKIVLALSQFIASYDNPIREWQYDLLPELSSFKIPHKIIPGFIYKVAVRGLARVADTQLLVGNMNVILLNKQIVSPNTVPFLTASSGVAPVSTSEAMLKDGVVKRNQDQSLKLSGNNCLSHKPSVETTKSQHTKNGQPEAQSNGGRMDHMMLNIAEENNNVLDLSITYVTRFYGNSSFRSVYTKSDIYKLLRQCQETMFGSPKSNSFLPCKYFFRDKFDDYWKEIFAKDCGVMQPLLKPNNGDPASPLNDQLKGLYFGTLVDLATLLPPTCSNFGPVRLQLLSSQFLTPSCRMYFSDFYCYGSGHYVALVLTVPGSQADRFCESHLVELNVHSNDFLKLSTQSVGTVFVTTRINVEVFYTENVIIQQRQLIRGLSCKRTSQTSGKTKNLGCRVCNLPEYVNSLSSI